MDLRRRLARLDGLTAKRPASPLRDGGPTEAAAPVDPAELGLTRSETPAGPLWWRESRDEVGALPARLPDLRGFFVGDEQPRPAPADLLLLDTETTGLMGGTGTLAFLVGLAWWEGSALVTRQLFLPGPGREAPLLAALAEAAAARRVLVTFNGHTFDLPLLRARCLLNRRPDPLGRLVGWDLLVPARRLWGRLLPDCRQQTLEREVCGLARGPGDIDGARIPQAWFDHLAGAGSGALRAVLTHNRRDMVGMALLLRRIVDIARALAHTGGPAATEADWREAWARGRVAERRREHGAAEAWLAAAADAAAADGAAWVQRTFLADAVRILKRGGDWARVERVIRRGLAADAGQAWLHREAAILYERRLVRPRDALRHALRAGDDRRVARLRRRWRELAAPREGAEP